MDTQGQVVALLDASGSFFEPAATAFPGAGAAAWEGAALLDPVRPGPGVPGGWTSGASPCPGRAAAGC